jgi:hypothetical protein
VRQLLVPLLLLLVGCKTFGADNSEADASVETPDAAPAAPCPNGSLQFDGKAFVKVEGGDSFDTLSDVSVEAWILPDAQITNTEVDIVSHHDDANSDGWVLFLKGGLGFRVYSGSGKGDAASGTLEEAKDSTLTLGAWHHVAAVFDGAASTITLYIDGKTNGRVAGKKKKADPYTGPLAIGASASVGANGFLGLIDEVRVSRNVRYPDAKTFTPVYPLPDNEDGTIGTWHFLNVKPTMEIANEASGKFTSTLATFATPTPSYPTAVLSTCPTGAR